MKTDFTELKSFSSGTGLGFIVHVAFVGCNCV